MTRHFVTLGATLGADPAERGANVEEQGQLSFPDGPRQELDEALTDLLTQAQRVRTAQGRLRALLAATHAVVEELDLPSVLRRIAAAARSLVDADYAALGVISPRGDSLEEFVYVGMSDDEAARIGHLPAGHGLLGALITDPRPIRLEHLTTDPRSAGFPAHHPPMDSFLGVPVRVRGDVYGNLYLTNGRGGGSFTTEDEELIGALATTAGYAIENARLLGRVRTRGTWMETAAELSAALLSSPTQTAPDLIAGRMLELPSVDKATVLLLTDDESERLQVAAARGADETRLRGMFLDPEDPLVADTVRSGDARAFGPEPSDDDVLRIVHDGTAGPLLVTALRTPARLWGVLCAARRPGGAWFTDTEMEAATHFGSRCAIALELAFARQDAQRALLAEDRRRIARDLHDHVIQTLYGTGLAIQAMVNASSPGADADRLNECITQIDDAIAQIRTIVFALSHGEDSSLRHQVIDVVADMSGSLHNPPAIRFTGPVDHAITGSFADEVVGVSRELLSNAVRHSKADRISLEVIVSHRDVEVVVQDDGIGIPPNGRRSGLRNLAERAAAHGGTLDIESARGATAVRWAVPLPGLAPTSAPPQEAAP